MRIFCLVIISFLYFNLFGQNKPIILVIDPGHGGKDPGKLASSREYWHEKEIVLDISLKLVAYIQEYLPEVKVLLTRSKDVFVSLEDRVAVANDNNADFMLSIHANSNPRKSIKGTETHIYSYQMKTTFQLAQAIEKEFKLRAGRHSRGIVDADERGKNLYVTQYTTMPSVLIETGYLSNPDEEKFLNSDNGRAIIASAIFRAFRDFIKDKYPSENRKKIYKVQIMASSKPVELDSSIFGDLEDKVIEYVNPNKEEKYRYKYMIGWEYDPKRAEKLAKKIANLGFPGAFVVAVE